MMAIKKRILRNVNVNMTIKLKQTGACLTSTTISCGVYQFSGVRYGSSLDSLYTLATKVYGLDGAGIARTGIIVFSDTARSGKGSGLYELISSLDIGKITVSDSTINPNSSNKIVLYTFIPNHIKFRHWLIDTINPPKHAAKVSTVQAKMPTTVYTRDSFGRFASTRVNAQPPRTDAYGRRVDASGRGYR